MLFLYKKTNDEKTVQKKVLPTYPSFFEHVTPNAYSFFLVLMANSGEFVFD